MEWSNNYPFDYVMEVNQTACSYLKQFDLIDNVILSVCNRDEEIMLDIGLFLNQTATIRGIPLNLRQWNVLQRASNSVNRAIEKGKHMKEPVIKEIVPIHDGAFKCLYSNSFLIRVEEYIRR